MPIEEKQCNAASLVVILDAAKLVPDSIPGQTTKKCDNELSSIDRTNGTIRIKLPTTQFSNDS